MNGQVKTFIKRLGALLLAALFLFGCANAANDHVNTDEPVPESVAVAYPSEDTVVLGTVEPIESDFAEVITPEPVTPTPEPTVLIPIEDSVG